ncbi:MAG: hypothetical protein R6V17_02255 [Halanaerobacter sp.]
MTRKVGIILLAIILLITAYYFVVITKLETKKEDLTVRLSQEVNQLDKNKEKLLTLQELKKKNKKLENKLQEQSDNNFLTSSDINDFIIRLNNAQVVEDIDFNSNPTQNLKLVFTLQGEFKEIYNFLTELQYSYDTERLTINNLDQGIEVALTLNFPIEGS